MLAIAGQTAGPNGQFFCLMEPMGAQGVTYAKTNFFFQIQNFVF